QILAATDPDADYTTLEVEQVNEAFAVRDPGGVGQSGRAQRRRSLAYFSQLTDFQLADEESPARVEFLDEVAGQGGASSAWRPWEALTPFMIDDSIRQINRFAAHSPVPQGNGTGNPMDLALITGDQADNMQRNEMIWTRSLLEGGVTLNFNSGVTDPSAYEDPEGASCDAFVTQEDLQTPAPGDGPAQAAAEAARYTGVQDYDDYPSPPPPNFYDPNNPTGDWAAWPEYTGLLDRAQMLSLTPAGLNVPSYWVNGNHDVLVQGNEDANQGFENIATGCFKALGTTIVPGSMPGPDALDPRVLLSPTAAGMLVPPDPLRRFASKVQTKAILGANNVDNDHGFSFVNPQQNQASDGSASYYAWNPPQTPGVRFIAIDTNSEGGIVGEGPQSGSSDGNLDHPQFLWLRDELNKAENQGKLIVIFGHHPVRTMDSVVPDEATGECTGVQHNHGDNPEHDTNPGCDPDPRTSEPLHFGNPEQADGLGSNAQTFTELIAGHSNVIAYVAGHTHEHQLLRCGTPRTGNPSDTNPQNARFCKNSQGNPTHLWWEVNTSAVADWPHQHRLIEVMDNRDDTLSIFGTVLDQASPATAPGPGNAAGFIARQLAAIGRTFGFNDPQSGPPSGEGDPQLDQNVEMLVDDPRQANLRITKRDDPDPVRIGGTVTYRLLVENLGPSPATAVSAWDRIPKQTSFISVETTRGTCSTSDDTVTCRVGDLGAGGKQRITIRARVGGIPRTMRNFAATAATTDDPAIQNNTDTENTRVIP
ncbi:MAG: hypothetical protein AABM66_12765, partial [Actinomycetota bacterium]